MWFWWRSSVSEELLELLLSKSLSRRINKRHGDQFSIIRHVQTVILPHLPPVQPVNNSRHLLLDNGINGKQRRWRDKRKRQHKDGIYSTFRQKSFSEVLEVLLNFAKTTFFNSVKLQTLRWRRVCPQRESGSVFSPQDSLGLFLEGGWRLHGDPKSG